MLQSMGLQRVTNMTERLNNKNKRETKRLCIYVEDFVKCVSITQAHVLMTQPVVQQDYCLVVCIGFQWNSHTYFSHIVCERFHATQTKLREIMWTFYYIVPYKKFAVPCIQQAVSIFKDCIMLERNLPFSSNFAM